MTAKLNLYTNYDILLALEKVYFIKMKDFKFHDGKEDHRVFVKGFCADIGKEEITKIFEVCGTIVDIRLPENRQVNKFIS